MGKVTLDIGCGQRKVPGSIGVDIRRTKEVDVVADVCCLPFKSESVDEILCFQTLEHVSDLLKAMEEIHRVLKWGGEQQLKCRMLKA